MSKAFICLTGCILIALAALRAGGQTQVAEKTSLNFQVVDTSVQVSDTVAAPVIDSIPAPVADTVTTVPRDSSPLPKESDPTPKKGRSARKRKSSTPKESSSVPEESSSVPKDTVSSPARDTAASPAPASIQAPSGQDTAAAPAQTPTVTTNVISTDTIPKTDQPAAAQPASQNTSASDTASGKKNEEDSKEETSRQLDTRWFISPLLKGQFQDFGMLEKNRKGYLSDANKLPFQQRGNGSFAASAYKNITGRLSVSADLGLSFGHVTNNDVLISQTKSKTYNLLNATIYYHLLPASYRLQPYVFVGINDLINDKSYLSAPAGIGAKFNAKKVMVIGQLAYGYAVNKNTANTTMYSVGIYLPLKNKKQKKMEEEEKANKNKDQNKKDTANKNGNIVNNIFITINMDSVLKAKGLLNDDGSPAGRKGGGVDDGDDDGSGSGGNGSGGRHKRKRGLRDDLKLDEDADLGKDDFKVDTIDGVPVIRFVVYFEFNEYSLTSKAFNSIDRVIGHLKLKDDLYIEIKGYTDNVGTESYNNFLSRRRAKMVLDYLNSRGVPSELMKAKAYGSDNPVGDNSDPNQAWLNRRAEIIVREKK
jgi:outer membrane protein OmpA-like peptidoglycan-associated protein